MILLFIAVLSLHTDIHVSQLIVVSALFSILILASIFKMMRYKEKIRVPIDIVEFLTILPISLILWIARQKEISSLIVLEICLIKMSEISLKQSTIIDLYLIGYESLWLFIEGSREGEKNYIIIICYGLQILIKIIQLISSYKELNKQQRTTYKSSQILVSKHEHSDMNKLIHNLYGSQKLLIINFNLELVEISFNLQKIIKNDLIQKDDEFQHLLKLQCQTKDNSTPSTLSGILKDMIEKQTKFQYCTKVQKGLISHTILLQIILLPDLKNILIHVLRFKNYSEIEKSQKEQLLVDICKSLSHNLGTNLNSIQTYSFNSLEDQQINQFVKEAYLKPIYENSQQLNLIISNLRDYNLIQLNQFSLMLEPFSIKEEIEKVQRLFTQAIEKKKIHVKNDLQDIITINDKQRFIQVYFQLFSNAIKFTENGIVRTEARKFTNNNQCYHQIVISDTGIGMNQLEAERLDGIISTGRFLRVSEHSVGSGFGICISNQIIKFLSGKNQRLYFEPQTQGTKFMMNMKIFEEDYLNDSQHEEENCNESQKMVRAAKKIQSQLRIHKDRSSYVVRINSLEHIKDQNSLNSVHRYVQLNESHMELQQSSELQIQYLPQFKPKLLDHLTKHIYCFEECCSKILAADDEIFNLRCLEMILSKYTKKIDFVFNGQDAIKQIAKKHQMPCSICKNRSYQIIFLDINMPILDGIKTAQKITDLIERDIIQKPYVIANSGFCDLETKEKAFDAGVDYYFTKPINQQELQSVVQNIIMEFLSRQSIILSQ